MSKWLRASGFMVGNSATDTVIYAARVQVGLELNVDSLWILLVEPLAEFVPLLRCEGIDGAFNLLYSC